MKAITLTQPWATLVAVGAKKIETRSWSTQYRGPLAIHASARIPREAQALCDREPFRTALRDVFLADGEIPLGCIVATCQLIECVPIRAPEAWYLNPELQRIKEELAKKYSIPPPEPELSFGDYAPGRYAWILSDVRELDVPIPAKGALGLWEWQKED